MKWTRQLTLSRLLVAITFIAVFAMATRAPLDTDMLWHLRAGEWQVANKALLRVDLFSYSRAGEPWINHSWLSQIIMYGFYRLLGDTGMALYTAILATAGMVFVYLTLEGNAAVKAFVTVLAGTAAAVFWSARPQMVSFFLSAVVFYLLWLYLEKDKDRLWFIPPIMLLWANLHGGFAIGFILMVLSTAGEAARWLFDEVIGGQEGPGLRRVGRLAVIGLVSAAAIGINPYGPRMILYPFRTVGIGVLQDFIQEWASPNFHEGQTWPFIWLLLATLALAGLSKRRLGWRDAVLVTGTAYASLLAGRNIATFAVVASPVLAAHTQSWLDELGLRLRLDRRPRGALAILNVAILLLALGAGVGKVVYALNPVLLLQAREERLPVTAVTYLEREQPPGPLFNSYNWGGYLILAARDYPVYVDGRTDLYDDELLRGYLNTYFAQPGWQARLDATGANIVLVEASAPLAQVLALSDGWTLGYADAVAVVYLREEPIQ